MVRSWLIYSFLGVMPVSVHAQQLVPNPSFENFTTCPTFASMLGNAEPWFNPTAGTPELYHGCAGSGTFAGVPMNYSGGFQYARTGQGFAGIYTYRIGNPEMREYIEVPLIEPLVADRCYRFTMYVNMPDDFELACDGVGAHFSVGALTSTDISTLPVDAHIEHPAGTIITDTVGWTEVSGIYTAMGGEDHLTIGNFRSDAETSWIMFNPGTWYANEAYLLVDDVSLVPIENELDLGPDTSICSTSPYILDAMVTGATSFLWNDGLTTAVRSVSSSGAFSVQVNVGGCAFTDTVVIDLRPMPMLDLGPDRSICNGLSLELLATADPESIITWEDGSIGNGHTVEIAGTYAAIATNSCGTAYDVVVVEYDDCPEEIYIPSAFTPNGDAINDVFMPVFDSRIWDLTFSIFDRWGREIFHSTDGSGWAAEDIPVGIYVVRAEASGRNSRMRQTYIGHVALVR